MTTSTVVLEIPNDIDNNHIFIDKKRISLSELFEVFGIDFDYLLNKRNILKIF